ncbi:Condensin complex subunit [Irineochytrium annulatum]|nr:Condensin complex subunit [Irineochytrium annulatum]
MLAGGNEFHLHHAILELQDGGALENEYVVPEHAADEIEEELDVLIGKLVDDGANILIEEISGKIKSFIKHYDTLTVGVANKLADILLDRYLDEVMLTNLDMEEGNQDNFENRRQTLELYSFLMHWLIEVSETRYRRGKKEKAQDPASKIKVSKKKEKGPWDWVEQRTKLFNAFVRCLNLDLTRAFTSTPEFASMITKSVSYVLEDVESVKVTDLKKAIFEILLICAKKYDSDLAKGVQTRVLQFLREEHLAETIAEFVHYSSGDGNFPQLCDAIIRETKGWEFTDNDQKVAKAFAKFLVKISEIIPEKTLKQMVYLQSHVESESYTIRMAMIEVIGNIIYGHLAKTQSETAFGQLLSLYNILEERYRDIKSFVRSKLLQVLTKLAMSRDVGVSSIPIERHEILVELTCGRLRDKASNVRKNAIKLLSELVRSSPFLVIESDRGKQSVELFETKKSELEGLLKDRFSTENAKDFDGEKEVDMLAEGTVRLSGSVGDKEAGLQQQEYVRLTRFHKYYSDGLRFLLQIENACPILCELMASNTKTEVIEAMKFFVCAHSFGMECSKTDLLLARNSCVALQQLGTIKRQKGNLLKQCNDLSDIGVSAKASQRYSAHDNLFLRLARLLLEANRSPDWFGFAQEALNVIYALSEHPDVISAHIIKRLTKTVFNVAASDEHVDYVESAMEQAFGYVNDGAAKPLAFAESMDISEDSAGDSDVQADAFDLSKLCFIVGHAAVKEIGHLEAIENDWKNHKASSDCRNTPGKPVDELDQVVGTAEDEFSEALAYIRERELLYGNKSLFNVYTAILVHICRFNLEFNLLFTILEKSSDPLIRSNTIIGLGDMTTSFNSLIDQNISYLYNRLRDSDLIVKKNTLMVLTHLVLNGMVKVKGQISEMAKCLLDEDKRISDLAKLFFTDLATKDNAVYNNLPDIISNLSHHDTGVDETAFAAIMKFLFDFIKKDKQVENIVDKLCLRFKNAENPRLWRDIAFCLSLLNFSSDKSVKRLMDSFPYYQDKLHEKSVYKTISDIVAKSRKATKAETKALVEEFEKKLIDAHEKCKENAESIQATKKIKKEETDELVDGLIELTLQ